MNYYKEDLCHITHRKSPKKTSTCVLCTDKIISGEESYIYNFAIPLAGRIRRIDFMCVPCHKLWHKHQTHLCDEYGYPIQGVVDSLMQQFDSFEYKQLDKIISEMEDGILPENLGFSDE